MLYDPKWDEPSMEGFLRFCESKPPEEEYFWADGLVCACGQYYRFLGREREWLTRTMGPIDGISWELDGIAADLYGPRTFGALAARLRERLRD
jgi:hypothetical protein